MATRVLAVDDNPINLKVVSITLHHAGYECFTADNGPAALEMAVSIMPEIILLDITMPDMDGYEVCRRLRGNPVTAGIPIMMLTAHDTLEEKIKGFESGADDYMVKPFQPAELQARLKVLLRRKLALPAPAQQVVKQGKVIGVFSLRGGVGVSTVATNLACGLAQLWGAPVALVDLSLTLGQSALMLNLSLRNTWSDLANIKVEEIEPELLQNVMINHSSGVSVLAAPRSVADGERIKPEMVTKVLEVLRARFSYVVLDLPHDFRETSLAGMDLADDVVTILAPELASVRAANGAIEVFNTLGYAREKVTLVMNWIFERRGLARKDIENVLRQPIKMVVPFSSETFVSAINLGNPPVLSGPTSAIGVLFEDFAFSLSRSEDVKEKPGNPSDTWKRVIERDNSRTPVKR